MYTRCDSPFCYQYIHHINRAIEALFVFHISQHCIHNIYNFIRPQQCMQILVKTHNSTYLGSDTRYIQIFSHQIPRYSFQIILPGRTRRFLTSVRLLSSIFHFFRTNNAEVSMVNTQCDSNHPVCPV